jgi:Spy/CpxP family protein refolding chaperone
MSKALRILLVASLSFNVMFAIGYLSGATKAQAPQGAEQAAALVTEELGLDGSQREAFLSLRQEAQQQTEELAQTAAVLHDQLCSESANPAADPAAVADLQKDLAAVRQVHEQCQLEHFRRFMKVLTPKQREKAVKMLHAKAGGRKVRKPGALQELDADKDGKLSAAERAKAIQSLRERHAGGREPKPKHRTPEQPTTGKKGDSL